MTISNQSNMTMEDVAVQVTRILKPLDVNELISELSPHENQSLFIDSQSKRKVIRAGRRGGKTTGVAILAVKALRAGRRVLYATPTTEQIDAFWFKVNIMLGEAIDSGAYRKNESKHTIEVVGTTQRIRAKTAWNADTLRGDYGDLLILDEYQLMNETAWKEVGAPMLIDNNGDAVFVYTPPSRASRSVSKATDKRHAPKMFKMAVEEMKIAKAEGRAPRWEAFHFTSYDNPHVSEEGIAEVAKDMTSLAFRQEIMAEDTEQVPGALWDREKMIDPYRIERAPELTRIVVAIDPSTTSTEVSDEAGIMVGGVDGEGHGYLLKDSTKRDSPRGWGRTAVNLYRDFGADRIVAETNNGGEMVGLTLETVLEKGEHISYKAVTATRGKIVRAEPIAALYEKGFIHHVGEFPEAEEELCSYVAGNKSPNRLDAIVWLFWELMLKAGVLGLVDYFAKGRAEAELKNLEKISTSPMVKPSIGESTLRCPECDSVTITDLSGGEKRCQICGKQFWPEGKKPNVARSLRSTFLKGM